MMAQGIVGRVGAFTWSAGASSCEGQAWRRAHHSERERGGNAAAARQRDDGSALWCGGAGGKPGGGGRVCGPALALEAAGALLLPLPAHLRVSLLPRVGLVTHTTTEAEDEVKRRLCEGRGVGEEG